MAEAAASFKTWIDSISEGLIIEKASSVCNGYPSTTYNGSVDELNDPTPLILMTGAAPGFAPWFDCTCTPAARPASASPGVATGCMPIFLPSTFVTAVDTVACDCLP